MLQALVDGPYKEEALVPKSLWLNANPLLKPTLLLTTEKNAVFAKWLHKQPDQIRHWVLYVRYGDEWSTEILTKDITSKELPRMKNNKTLYDVAVRGVDRLGNESDYIAKRVQRK